MSRAVTWIGAVAVVLFAAGVTLVVTQPGDLGDDDDVALSTSTTQGTVPETTTSVPTTGPATTAPAPGGTGTGGTGAGPGDGSGLGADGAGTAQPGELVDSGHESLAVPGLLLLAAAGALARRRRPS